VGFYLWAVPRFRCFFSASGTFSISFSLAINWSSREELSAVIGQKSVFPHMKYIYKYTQCNKYLINQQKKKSGVECPSHTAYTQQVRSTSFSQRCDGCSGCKIFISLTKLMKNARLANDERSDIDHIVLSAVASAEKRKSSSKCQLISCRVAGQTFPIFVWFAYIYVYLVGHKKSVWILEKY